MKQTIKNILDFIERKILRTQNILDKKQTPIEVLRAEQKRYDKVLKEINEATRKRIIIKP